MRRGPMALYDVKRGIDIKVYSPHRLSRVGKFRVQKQAKALSVLCFVISEGYEFAAAFFQDGAL